MLIMTKRRADFVVCLVGKVYGTCIIAQDVQTSGLNFFSKAEKQK